MKQINKINSFCISVLLMAIICLFGACSQDDEVTPKTLEEYKQEFSQYVKAETQKTEACVEEGYNKGNFKEYRATGDAGIVFLTAKDNYLTVLYAAQQLLTKENLTIAEIVASRESLAAPGAIFTKYYCIADLRPLHEAVLAAEALNRTATVGTESGQVSQEAKNIFEEALRAARNLRNAATTTEELISNAITRLDKSTQIFKNAIIK